MESLSAAAENNEMRHRTYTSTYTREHNRTSVNENSSTSKALYKHGNLMSREF